MDSDHTDDANRMKSIQKLQIECEKSIQQIQNYYQPHFTVFEKEIQAAKDKYDTKRVQRLTSKKVQLHNQCAQELYTFHIQQLLYQTIHQQQAQIVDLKQELKENDMVWINHMDELEASYKEEREINISLQIQSQTMYSDLRRNYTELRDKSESQRRILERKYVKMLKHINYKS